MPADQTDHLLDSIDLGRHAREASAGLARIAAVVEATGPMHVRGRMHYCRHALGVARITAAQFVADPGQFDLVEPPPATGPESREVPWQAEAAARKAARPDQWEAIADEFEALVGHVNHLAHVYAARQFPVALKWEKAGRLIADAWETLKMAGVMVPEESCIPTHDPRGRPRRQHNRAGMQRARRA